MRLLSDDEFNERINKIERNNKAHEQRMLMFKKRMSIFGFRIPPTSKIALWVVIVICMQIIFFAERMIYLTGDTSSIVALVGAVSSVVAALLGYYHKSGKENTSGGIVYDSAMFGFKDRIVCPETVDKAEG